MQSHVRATQDSDRPLVTTRIVNICRRHVVDVTCMTSSHLTLTTAPSRGQVVNYITKGTPTFRLRAWTEVQYHSVLITRVCTHLCFIRVTGRGREGIGGTEGGREREVLYTSYIRWLIFTRRNNDIYCIEKRCWFTWTRLEILAFNARTHARTQCTGNMIFISRNIRIEIRLFAHFYRWVRREANYGFSVTWCKYIIRAQIVFNTPGCGTVYASRAWAFQ